MDPIKRSMRAFLLLIGSYALLTFLYVLPVDGIYMQARTMSVFYLIPAVAALMYYQTRIIDKRVRGYLVGVGAMIVFWCVLRAAKYVAFEENETVARYIWYLYYLTMLSIPQFSFQASLSVGRPEDKKLPAVQKVTGVICVLCILIVLTNDFHQLVFRFRPDFAGWDTDYMRLPLFWIITVWDYLFFFFSTAVLFHKCRLSASRKLTWIPVGYLGFGVLGLYLLNTGNLVRVWGNTVGEFPDMACYTLGGFWILCITIGLVPSNKGYGKLLQETSLAAGIADLDHSIVYQSRSAMPLTKVQLASPGPLAIDENTVLFREPVTGGYAYWQVDVTELNRINRELEEAQEQMEEEAELIRQANDLKERRAQIDAKSGMYDAIAVKVLPNSRKIARLSREVRENPAKFEENMRIISICAAYIKRISNMMLAFGADGMQIKELTLALAESVRYVANAGIVAAVDDTGEDRIVSAAQLILRYEQFESLLEQALPTLKGLQIHLAGDTLMITFEGAILTLPPESDGTAEVDEDTTFVRLPLPGGGDDR